MQIVSGFSERYDLAEPTLVWGVSSPFSYSSRLWFERTAF
jgi:hypothetical protein